MSKERNEKSPPIKIIDRIGKKVEKLLAKPVSRRSVLQGLLKGSAASLALGGASSLAVQNKSDGEDSGFDMDDFFRQHYTELTSKKRRNF